MGRVFTYVSVPDTGGRWEEIERRLQQVPPVLSKFTRICAMTRMFNHDHDEVCTP